jgi:carbon monoxide dehydrogenase subunit G
MPSRIETSIEIAAPVTVVWDEIAQIERHVEWMADAESIDFVSETQRGRGTRIEVLTRIGPLRTSDVMEFTAWEPPHRMAIQHVGLVSGSGEFTLEEAGADRTLFTWRETLDFPLRFGGRLGAALAKPILTRVWRKNLERLAGRFD